MGLLIFITVVLFIVASAAGCFPDKQKTARKLSIAACLMMALTAVLSLVVKEGMFRDFCALPPGMLLKTSLSVVLTLAAGAALIILLDTIRRHTK